MQKSSALTLIANLAGSVALATGALGIISCQGDSDTSQGSGGSAECARACARCGSDLCVDCGATAARYRDDFEAALYSCVLEGDAACSTLWSSCMTTASAHVSPRSIDDTYRNACLAKRTDCSSQGVNIADDLCLSSSLLEEAKVTEANQCLDKSCADIRSCLTAIFQ